MSLFKWVTYIVAVLALFAAGSEAESDSVQIMVTGGSVLVLGLAAALIRKMEWY